MHNLQQIIDELLPAFPELSGKKIDLNYARLDSDTNLECGEYHIINRYWIDVSEDLGEAPRDAIVGGLAHELCHFVLGSTNTIRQGILYKISKSYRTLVERNTDLEVIKRGFGLRLLALILFNKNNDDDHDPEAGLSLEELEGLLKN